MKGPLARRPRVLVVHHDREVAAILGARLGRCGFDVIESDRRDDALAVARLGKADVTVIARDLGRQPRLELAQRLAHFTLRDPAPRKPKRSDLCAELKQTPGLDMPVVMLTESAAEEDIDAAFELGVDECLTTPCSVDELSAILVSLVRERTMRQTTVSDRRHAARERTTRAPTASEPAHAARPAKRAQPSLLCGFIVLGYLAVRRLARQTA
jgi:DNA-binding response OmpR family regulator